MVGLFAHETSEHETSENASFKKSGQSCTVQTTYRPSLVDEPSDHASSGERNIKSQSPPTLWLITTAHGFGDLITVLVRAGDAFCHASAAVVPPVVAIAIPYRTNGDSLVAQCHLRAMMAMGMIILIIGRSVDNHFIRERWQSRATDNQGGRTGNNCSSHLHILHDFQENERPN